MDYQKIGYQQLYERLIKTNNNNSFGIKAWEEEMGMGIYLINLFVYFFSDKSFG